MSAPKTGSTLTRLAWFVVLWLASVTVLGLAAWLIRLILKS